MKLLSDLIMATFIKITKIKFIIGNLLEWLNKY